MNKKNCKYCSKEIEFEKHQQFAGHVSNCDFNPNKKIRNEKIKLLLTGRKKESIKKEYILNCEKCGKEYKILCTEHSYNIRKYTKNCSRQCANSHIRTEESKKKTSESMKKSEKVNKIVKKGIKTKKKSNVYFNNCIECNKLFASKNYKITCSLNCRIDYLIKNRKRNFFHKGKYKNFNLDSSWELKIAKLLDKLEIKWERGKILKYFSEDKKEHKFYPDFYLPEYDLYLEPKNKLLMEKQKFKIEYFQKRINIIFGDVEDILNKINSLVYQKLDSQSDKLKVGMAEFP